MHYLSIVRAHKFMWLVVAGKLSSVGIISRHMNQSGVTEPASSPWGDLAASWLKYNPPLTKRGVPRVLNNCGEYKSRTALLHQRCLDSTDCILARPESNSDSDLLQRKASMTQNKHDGTTISLSEDISSDRTDTTKRPMYAHLNVYTWASI